eukprot:1159818-Pelagomonas_calceolata.AAC.6
MKGNGEENTKATIAVPQTNHIQAAHADSVTYLWHNMPLGQHGSQLRALALHCADHRNAAICMQAFQGLVQRREVRACAFDGNE